MEELTLVSPIAPTGNYRPAVMARLRQKYVQHLGGTGSGRRLYVSRARAPLRRVANEDALVRLLSRHRIERVFLEELPFDQEVRLLSETDLLVGSHGAGLTNMLFMPEGGRVVEFRRTGDAANNCYFSLASDLGHSYHYVLCNPVQAGRDTHTADVAVDLEQVEKVLVAL
jgi:capsular polysaccharide biosynthesis protein